jgi:thioredoxin reductase
VVHENATLDTIKTGQFDSVIVATGSMPLELDVPGADKGIVRGAMEILDGEVPEGQRVLVVGGGRTGTETGLFLAERGKQVIIVEMRDEFMNEIRPLDQMVYLERLDKHNVSKHTGKRLDSVLDGGAVIVDRYGNRQEIMVDSIVVAAASVSNSSLAKELEEEGLEVYTVGDSVRPRTLFDAIHEGYHAAFSLNRD